MTQMQCTNCDGLISSELEKCPHCGVALSLQGSAAADEPVQAAFSLSPKDSNDEMDGEISTDAGASSGFSISSKAESEGGAEVSPGFELETKPTAAGPVVEENPAAPAPDHGGASSDHGGASSGFQQVHLTNYKGRIEMRNPYTRQEKVITSTSTFAVAVFSWVYMLFWRRMWLHGTICLALSCFFPWIAGFVYAFIYKKLLVEQYRTQGFVVVRHLPS